MKSMKRVDVNLHNVKGRNPSWRVISSDFHQFANFKLNEIHFTPVEYAKSYSAEQILKFVRETYSTANAQLSKIVNLSTLLSTVLSNYLSFFEKLGPACFEMLHFLRFWK